MKRVGLIRVISEVDPEKYESHALLMTSVYPSLDVVTSAIKGFPEGIYNRELAQRAIPAILKVAKVLTGQVDALAVSCVEDPGVEELRLRFSLPVVGAGSSLAWACQALGRKVGVLTITENLPTPLQTMFVDCSAVWRKVKGVGNTTDLQDAREAILETASRLVDQGCEAIALGCTGLSTVRAAAFLGQHLDLPVLDPVLAMGAILTAFH